MSNHQAPQGPGPNGPPSAGIMQHSAGGQAPQSQGQNLSQQNLNQIVLEYLVKKGYNRTEATLRAESAHVDSDGRPIPTAPDAQGYPKYAKAYTLIRDWAEGVLEVYKFEARRLLWPMFVYAFLELANSHGATESEKFFAAFSAPFESLHADELRQLETIKLATHVAENQTAQIYRTNKYRIPLNTHVYYNLTTFLEQKTTEGGGTILYLIQAYCELRETQRGPLDQYSFDAIVNKARSLNVDELDVQEGIEGAFTGVSNKDIAENLVQLKLGPMELDPDLIADVRSDLEDEDKQNPPPAGKLSLVDEFERNIKREDSLEGPTRAEVPYPPSRARDVVMEVQKIKEYRDRFKIEGRTGGTGVGVSVCMFTFHNTLDSITCIEFSDDTNLVAVGTEESYIRVWNLHGDPLPSIISGTNSGPPSASRRLIGHSAPVYGVSFAPSIDAPDNADASTPSTGPKLLLSSSADGCIRLWSLESWTCLVVFKGHERTAWNVKWSPHGHYFASCGWDKTVRIWAQDHISAVRLCVGHDTSVNQIAWHPNGAYVFSASDQADKTVRMWAMVSGECVRVFTGHTEYISALECSPSGKILASADTGGSIILWDIAKGTQIKRCRGHGKGGIWSLSFSVESTALVSGGADGTVRVWDIKVPTDPHQGADGEVIGNGGQADATRITNQASGSQPGPATAAGGKKKGKDTMITPDQISAFPTKKSPVYKVKFTRMNLVMAGGCYLP
ncbi:probable transcription initiation factor TFIID subunit 5 [Phialocephala subalpina]|uniref:Probable transcription initiation factor TFIID subunit 5 n=1 Tax=Phialocephala subalpina TaxID=576137 RepID=A0A1L7XQI3_9HELO|nr:probable transcription initiation factor TFIID subunit 5 [Phialocephala subalpina]